MKIVQPIKKRLYFYSLFLLIILSGCSENMKTFKINEATTVACKMIYENNFDNGLDDWKVEQMPKGKVAVANSKLEITDVSGCTVWLKQEFSGSIVVTYDVVVIGEGGPQDRVSDLNCFWMAMDPENPTDLFVNSQKRGGKFSNYDSLKLYYMGVGGNDNGTTRFRRYVGNGERPLLPEHDLKGSKNMLEPNKAYAIKIVAHNGIVQYYRDDSLLIDFVDDNAYTSGHFGFRTVNNHMTVDNFKVYQIQN